LFSAAEANKVNYVVLRFIYLFQRENIAMFPTYRLTGVSTTTTFTSGSVARLEAIERDLQLSNCASSAARIRAQREKIRKQKEAEATNRDLNLIVLDASMARRVQGRAKHQLLLLQALKKMLQSVKKHHLLTRYVEWRDFSRSRRKYRPLRRRMTLLLKDLNKNALRSRFQKWVKFVKICRQRTAAGLKPRDFEARKQSIVMMELADLARAEEKRLELERQEQIRVQMEEDLRAEEEARRIAEANRVPTPPPKIADVIARELETVYDAWYMAETAKGSAGTLEQLDAVKNAFRNSLTVFMTSDHGLGDLERLEGLTEDERLVEVDSLTQTVSPFLISLMTSTRYLTKANRELIQCLLAVTHEIVDYRRIFFEDELFLSVIADKNTEYFTLMLTTIPGFEIADEFLLELMTLCIKSEMNYLDFVEIALNNGKVCKFKGQKDALCAHWAAFFDKCIPSSSKGGAASPTASTGQTVANHRHRQRIVVLLERICLDHNTFKFDHVVELRDKQTFLSRLCLNGDLDLVEIYCSLVDEDVLRTLLTRKQKDETTCLAAAVKSQNVDLVQYLLSTHTCCSENINGKIDGYSTILDIAKVKGNIPAVISLLRQYGAKDPADEHENSRSGQHPDGLELDDLPNDHREDVEALDALASSGSNMDLDDALDF
jgi:hypothetical protein